MMFNLDSRPGLRTFMAEDMHGISVVTLNTRTSHS
jgi:hypothetical protein